MAFQRIRIKNTNVAGKIPGADKLDTAELCINLKDQKLFSKDADGNVFELGKTAVNNGPTPPGSGNEVGDLWWDGDNLLVWNGSSWETVGAVTSVNGEVGDVVLELGDLNDVAVDGVANEQVLVYDQASGNWVPTNAASLAVDVDLGYTPDPAKGTVTNSAGDDAELPLVDETNAGLMSPSDFTKLGEMPSIIANGTPPSNPSPGNIWIDLNDCPPTINIWSDCEDPGNPSWTPIGGGGGTCVQMPVSITSDNGNELYATLTAVGGNGSDEGALTAIYEWTGAKIGTGAVILADAEGTYTVTATITCANGDDLSETATYEITNTYVEMVNDAAPVIDVDGNNATEAYQGRPVNIVSSATVLNGKAPEITETRWYVDGTLVETNTGAMLLNSFTIPDSSVGSVITMRQLFTDDRSPTYQEELLSDASNSITIVEAPADLIDFDASITDDGTLEGNHVGKNLTANATNITGGTSPEVRAYQWYADGAAEAGPDGASQVKQISDYDIGKTITCEITVAEPDNTNPVKKTATYARIPELGVAIETPTILSPGQNSSVLDPVFTSSSPSTSEGAVTTWGVAEWNLAEDSNFTAGLQERTISITDAGIAQAGPTDFALSEDTDYYVRVKYTSTVPNTESAWSSTVLFTNSAVLPIPDSWAPVFSTGATGNVTNLNANSTHWVFSQKVSGILTVVYNSNDNAASFSESARSPHASATFNSSSIEPIDETSEFLFAIIADPESDKGFRKVSYADVEDTFPSPITGVGVSLTTNTTVEGTCRTSTGRIVAVGTGGQFIFYSDDNGDNWTKASTIQPGDWSDVAVGMVGGTERLVTVRPKGNASSKVAHSDDDGDTWTMDVAPNGNGFTAVTYGDGRFVAVANASESSNGRQAMWSEDGINWTEYNFGSTYGWEDVEYGEGVFVAVGTKTVNKITWSDDGGETWNLVAPGNSANIYCVHYARGVWCFVDNTGGVYTSTTTRIREGSAAKALFFDEVHNQHVTDIDLVNHYGISSTRSGMPELGLTLVEVYEEPT